MKLAKVPRPTGRKRSFWRYFLVKNLVFLAIAYVIGSFVLAEALLRGGEVSRGIERPRPERAEDVLIRTEDGIDLSGWVLEPKAPARATVLLFHGIGDVRLGGWMPWLAECGYRSIALGHRGHGKSSGKRTTFGWDERRDVVAVARFGRERFPAEPIILWGVSMGGAAVAYAAREVGTAAAVIIESCYATIDEAYDNRLKLQAPEWLVFLGHGPRLAVEWRGGLERADLRPVDHVRGFTGDQLFVIAGGADPLATPGESERIAGAVPGAALWIVPKAEHAACSGPNPAEYKSKVRAFFDRRTAR